MIATLKKLETEFAMGAVSFIEYAMRWSMLVERINEARTPVADAAWWIVDNVGASRVWLDGAHPNDIIAERDKMKAGIERMADIFTPRPRDILTMPWPRLDSRYLGPFALAPREWVVECEIFFPQGLTPAYPHRQEIADKAEFLWRTQQLDKSHILSALEGPIGSIRATHAVRVGVVEACADAALRLYHSGWPIHAFDGLTRAQIVGHAVKLNRKSEAPPVGRYRFEARSNKRTPFYRTRLHESYDSGWMPLPPDSSPSNAYVLAMANCPEGFTVQSVWSEVSA